MPSDSEPPFEPGPWPIERAAYYADRAYVNHSSLEVFRRSRPTYYRRFVVGDLPDKPPSPAMRLGTWLHMAVLEPLRWKSGHLVLPDDLDRRRKADRELYDELLRDGRELLTGPEAAQVERMADAVRSDPLVRQWLEYPGQHEQIVRWREPFTGLACKAMLDWVCGGMVVLDLKTAAEPWPWAFGLAAASYGYHRQAAHYLDGAREALRMQAPDFIHVVVGSEEPHEVFCCELKQRVGFATESCPLELGETQRRRSLADLAECRATGSWHAPERGQVNPIRLPRYAHDEL